MDYTANNHKIYNSELIFVICHWCFYHIVFITPKRAAGIV